MVVFSEDHTHETCRRGRIEVVCGSMFSGKTEELIRRLKRATFARQRVEIFKPAIDTRYSEAEVVSHDNNSIPSTPVDSSASILLFSSEIDVVGIDEAQFFDDGLVNVCNELADRGVRVIIAGLDMDFKGVPTFFMASDTKLMTSGASIQNRVQPIMRPVCALTMAFIIPSICCKVRARGMAAAGNRDT